LKPCRIRTESVASLTCVSGIWACYKEWGDKRAFLLTEPLPNPDGWEWRCYTRDPDGYTIKVGEYTQLAIDWSAATVELISHSSTLYFRQCAMHKMDRDRTLANG
jgi:hypothetical protein